MSAHASTQACVHNDTNFSPLAIGWYLQAFFPSKVGGLPAWLTPPEGEELKGGSVKCGHCGGPTRFLLQLYTGGNWPHADAFHRTVMLFACATPACYHRGDGPATHVRALRSQLSRANAFYPQVPPNPDESPDVAIARCDARLRESLQVPVHEHAPAPYQQLALVIDEEPAAAAAAGEVGTREGDDASTSPEEEGSSTAQGEESGSAGLDDVEFNEGELPSMGHRRALDSTFARFKARVAPEPTQVVRCVCRLGTLAPA
jgi:hypothetical protein